MLQEIAPQNGTAEQKKVTRKVKHYDKDFKKSLVARLLNGENVMSIKNETGVSDVTLYTWRKQAKAKKKYRNITKDIKPVVREQRNASPLSQTLQIIETACKKLDEVSNILRNLYH